MLRYLILTILLSTIITAKNYAQEWLTAYNQSLAYYADEQFENALTECEAALVKYKGEAAEDHANYRVILRQLSVICYSLDELEDSKGFAEQEVESWRTASKADEGSYIDALDNLGLIYAALGDYKSSIEVLYESHIAVKEFAGKADIDKAVIEGHLAEALYADGQLARSTQHFTSCMKVLDVADEFPQDYFNFCYSYGSLCEEQDDYIEAIKYFTMLFQWYDETDNEPLIIRTNIGLGTVYTKYHRLELGEHHLLLARTSILNDLDDVNKEFEEVTKLLALNLEQQGRHEEAKVLMEEISAGILEDNEESEEQASFLNTQATILLNTGKLNEAIITYQQALEMLAGLQLKHSETYLIISLNAIKANAQAGNLIAAASLAETVIAAQETENIYYFMLVAELGTILRQQGDYNSANRQFEIIYIASRNKWPSRAKAQILNKTASHYQVLGKYVESNNLYQEALATLVPENDKVIYQAVMFNYMTLLQAQGKRDEAQKLLDELKVSLGTENSEIYLGVLRNIGNLAHLKGDYTTAKARYSEALALAKELAGDASALYADILLRLATLDKDLGNYQEAEAKFIMVSQMIANLQGTQHPNYASVANNMGILFQQMGNYEKAEAKFVEAVTIYKSAFGESNPDYVLSLENLATLYELVGEKEKALEILAFTLAANKNIYGEFNPNYAISLHNYASLLQKTDRQDEAFTMLLEVLSLQRSTAGKVQPSYANTLHNLAILAQEKENYALADSLINEVIEIRGVLFDTNHPSYTSALFSKAVLLQVTNNYDEAWLVYNKVIDQYLNQINKYFPSLSEKEKNAFYAKLAPVVNRYKEFCVEYYFNNNQTPEVLGRLYNVHLATKALLLNAVNKTRTSILASGDQALIAKFNQWTNLKKQLINYYSFSREQLVSDGIVISTLEEEANTLEKSLSKSSLLFADEFEQSKVTWKHIAEKLPADEAAVELIRIERNSTQDSVTYAALVILADSPHPALVTLPYGLQMEGKYYNFYKNTIKFKVHDKLSYEVYWQPVDRLIKGVKTVYISADGVYNKVNINTIFNINSSNYVIEDYFVKFLSSTRDLLKSPKEITSSNLSMLCIGDPTYDLNGQVGVAAELNDLQRSQLNMSRISPLPGTKKEIAYIDSLMSANNWQVNSFFGVNALEIEIKRAISPTVIHLATHGFFMTDLKVKQIENAAGRNEFDKNPLFRSGLLFAGASNIHQDIANDGVLTAYEAMNLSLDNTKLVVLSACETALGEIKNGEGVYGLQRALLVAGAQKIIMSLWRVNDEATMQLMSLFYSNWVKGGDIYQSLQKAQVEMMHEHEEPYYWGAFIMIGK